MPFEDEFNRREVRREPPAVLDKLARQVIGAAIEVHRGLGSGLPVSHMRIKNQPLALFIKFNVSVRKEGIRRVISS
jgi:hypothetical protein